MEVIKEVMKDVEKLMLDEDGFIPVIKKMTRLLKACIGILTSTSCRTA
ncbi:hypothetical protein [Phocaeicola sartorii]|nr:hypothetical protein [Phocaeicola sartorii]